MNRDNLKKKMLLKKEEDSIQIFRVLAIEKEKVLVIDCIKKTMPVWVEIEKLDDFVKEQESNQSGETDTDILEDYSPDVRKVIYQRYNIISAILPFAADEAMRSELIAKMAGEHGISKQSVRKYLCEYLAAQDIRSLAPQERNTDRALTQDEKNMRKALNKYYYTTKKRTLKNVYTMMLRDSYCDGEGKLFGTYPSFYQFRYLGKFVTDMGSEYKSCNFEQITDLGVQIINLPSYRPELKSKVEKFFDCIQSYYRNQLKGKGVVEPDFQERGVHDYRKDACLTMADFEKIIIHCILFYNCKRVLENFPYTEEMLSQGIKPYANEIWNYGCGKEGCSLINVYREQLVLTLLPRATGKFTRYGLAVNGMHYHNINFREQYLNGKECLVAYNPDNVCQIWLIENGSYIPFDLIESRYREKNLTGVQEMKQWQRDLVRQEAEKRTQAELDLAGHISAIAGASGEQTKPSVKNIRANREKERRKLHKDLGKEVALNVY